MKEDNNKLQNNISDKRIDELSVLERVSYYEKLYDEVSAARPYRTDDFAKKRKMLDDYYTSGQWRDDYEADEQGLLPDDLKRGVLSQDALYDLLCETENE